MCQAIAEFHYCKCTNPICPLPQYHASAPVSRGPYELCAYYKDAHPDSQSHIHIPDCPYLVYERCDNLQNFYSRDLCLVCQQSACGSRCLVGFDNKDFWAFNRADIERRYAPHQHLVTLPREPNPYESRSRRGSTATIRPTALTREEIQDTPETVGRWTVVSRPARSRRRTV